MITVACTPPQRSQREFITRRSMRDWICIVTGIERSVTSEASATMRVKWVCSSCSATLTLNT
jgi:hypothetical protein